ncbi:MAG TPA: MerR family transcriptional regulator [Acidimicrobiales bacterium]|nr:MerR family transcriptional regulator [Acidimicrobiales bacterium]
MSTADVGERGLRIGEAAQLAGVSPRTLRYYQELGLLQPSGRTPGGARRYDKTDVERLCRIRELQELMGFNLEEIAVVLQAEDRLAGLRAEWEAGQPPERREEMLNEARQLNQRLQSQVRAKLDRLGTFLTDLETRATRYEDVAAELKSEVDKAESQPPTTA